MVKRVIVILTLVLVVIMFPPLSYQAAAPQVSILYYVNSDLDHTDGNIGDGVCETGMGTGVQCTLRAAIQEANRDNFSSTIKFSSQMSINYPTLEGLSESGTTIDAGDQWDGVWPFGQPGVSIGAGGYTSGLLAISGDNTKIYGLEFTGGGNTGISITGGNGAVIGGTGTNQRNIISFLA